MSSTRPTRAGRYQLESKMATVLVQGTRLVLTLPGQRHVLEPKRGLRFGLHGLSGYSVDFILDASGNPSEARLTQPEGVFVATRSD
ncbi:MAG: hypothetical protein ABIP94_05065 [Planctomycetota bacterium]